MQKISYVVSFVLLAIGILLMIFSPDILSMAVVGIMCVIVVISSIIGIIPILSFATAFKRATENITRNAKTNKGSLWKTVSMQEELFHQKTLDAIMEEYKEKVNNQIEAEQITCDIEDYINDETVAVSVWNGIMVQIPGTLTGLGILGTFIGLMTGIGEIGFSSVEATLNSVETLLSGIEVAFYTSIAGVILSILFNIAYRTVWNIAIRQMTVFTEEFHKHVMATTEEQDRYRKEKDVKKIIERLDRIPKNAGFSLGNSIGSTSVNIGSGEGIIMPQIIDGIKNGEFIFYLQEKYDVSSKRVTGAEALVRWQHKKLGLVSPSVFIPIIEKNGYIVKLDCYIWEQVCSKIRVWIDSGYNIAPISVNVSKTDIMAMNVGEFFLDMVKKYHIPPRYLDIEIAKNAYLEAQEPAREAESMLRQAGFKVILDGFDGNFVPIGSEDYTSADEWNLDLRFCNGASLPEIFRQARELNINLSAVGVENMEQVSILKKSGCHDVQGYHFSKPISIEEFEKRFV